MSLIVTLNYFTLVSSIVSLLVIACGYVVALLRPRMLDHLVILVIRRWEGQSEMSGLGLWALNLRAILPAHIVFVFNIRWVICPTSSAHLIGGGRHRLFFIEMLRIGEIWASFNLRLREKVIEVGPRRIELPLNLVAGLYIYVHEGGDPGELTLHELMPWRRRSGVFSTKCSLYSGLDLLLSSFTKIVIHSFVSHTRRLNLRNEHWLIIWFSSCISKAT